MSDENGRVIRHDVFVRFPTDLAQATIDELLHGIHAVCARLPGVLGVLVGPNRSPEELVVHGFRHGFVFDAELD